MTHPTDFLDEDYAYIQYLKDKCRLLECENKDLKNELRQLYNDHNQSHNQRDHDAQLHQ